MQHEPPKRWYHTIYSFKTRKIMTRNLIAHFCFTEAINATLGTKITVRYDTSARNTGCNVM